MLWFAVPLKRLAWNVSPMPLIAPPPLGRLSAAWVPLEVLLTVVLSAPTDG
jgi:hypothetical protein